MPESKDDRGWQGPFRKTPYGLPLDGDPSLWHSLFNVEALSILWYPRDQAECFITAHTEIS